MIKKGLLFGAVGAVVLAVGVFFGGKAYQYRFGKPFGRAGVVRIASGTSFGELTRMLVDSGYLKQERRWSAMAKKHGHTQVQGGNYALSPAMSYRTALTRFQLGQQTPVRLTFNNIRTLERLAGVVARYIEPDSAQLVTTLRDEAVIRENGFTPATFPALFIPNTYEVYWTLTPGGFVERMRREYDRFWTQERQDKAKSLGYSPIQITTLASIVIEETKLQSEMTAVAGVYLNRLKRGVPLQADPTVKFALGDPTIRRVLNRHLNYDSPYNTYKYSGLPPGPICIAPIVAIDAVLAYSEPDRKHDYYYFCAAADFSGRHLFAKTLRTNSDYFPIQH